MPNLNSAIKKGYTVLFGKGLKKVEKKKKLLIMFFQQLVS